MHAGLREPDGDPRLPRDADRPAATQYQCSGHVVSSSEGDAPTAACAAGCTVGMRRVKNSANTAKTASSESDERNAASRALSFSSTIASAVLPETPASSSA